MKRNLYALLVGIDQYPNPNERLEGCVNDINAVKDYLEQWSASDNYQLHLQTLLDQDATREGIIQKFQTHLSQADSHDVALFYYSGHGSQEENIPEVLWRFEPDRKNETLYCYDSGQPGKWHLADKELAKLIAQVAVKQPHICVILDCCHSASGTRDSSSDVVDRSAPGDKRVRPLESYLFNLEDLSLLYSDPGINQSSTGWEFSQGQHILMAACEDHDTAKEVTIDDKKRGIFSYCLLETLKRPGKFTYRDLLQETKNRVAIELEKRSRTQSPQLEVTPPDQGNLLFLNGAIAERASYFTVRYNKGLGWVIDGGAVHGVRPPDGAEATSLALFRLDCNVRDLQNPQQSIGEAKVTNVLPQLSQLEISPNTKLLTECLYKAVVISLPLPAYGVYPEGDTTGVTLAEQAIQAATMGNRSSIYIRPVPSRDQAQLWLQCQNQEYRIRLKDDNRPLVAPLPGFTADSAKRAIARLEHIARWLTIRDLSSPPASQIQPDDIVMELLFEGENSVLAKEIRREYQYKEGKYQPPKCQLKLTNKSQKTLYCTVLDLTDRFAVAAPFFEAGYVRLEPEQTAWAKNGKSFRFSVDPELQELGITETKDILKLIVSTAEFDARLSTQEELDVPRSSTKSAFKQSTLNRLMDRAQFRTVRSDEEETYDDWYTQNVIVTTALTSK